MGWILLGVSVVLVWIAFRTLEERPFSDHAFKVPKPKQEDASAKGFGSSDAKKK